MLNAALLGHKERSAGMLICWPGSQATAGVIGDKPGDEHLIMLLDPLDMALTVPPNPEDRLPTARFLRELAHSATLMADRIDPEGTARPRWEAAPDDSDSASS
jgi:hypothetical protein